jgi:MoxR-like ATPase
MSTATITPTKLSLRQQIAAWVEHLDRDLHERRVAVRLAVLAPFAGHHLLLLGPPGTAKTLLATRVTAMFGGQLFSTMLTKFSTPDEVFGPLSLPELERGLYRRQTKGYLPKADFAFVDEIYKASPSILNALLTVLNERVYFNGEKREEIDLKAMLAASNEVPEPEDGLEALDDRLLLRVCVEPLKEPSAFMAMLQHGRRDDRSPSAPASLPVAAVDALQARARKVRLADGLGAALLEVRGACQKQGLAVSDRRWRQAFEAMAMCAAIDGEQEVGPAHLGVLRYALWRRPADQPKVIDALVEGVKAVRPTGVTASKQELEQSLAQQKAALDRVNTELWQREQYYYGQTDVGALVGNAREALRKLRAALDAVQEEREALRRSLAGPDGSLWAPFWTDVLPRLAGTISAPGLRQSDVWARLARWPELASEKDEILRQLDALGVQS